MNTRGDSELIELQPQIHQIERSLTVDKLAEQVHRGFRPPATPSATRRTIQKVSRTVTKLYAKYHEYWEWLQSMLGLGAFSLSVYSTYQFVDNEPTSNADVTVAYRVVSVFFLVDFFLRFALTPAKLHFLKRVETLVDIAIIFPPLFLTDKEKAFYLLQSIRLLRITRVLSIYESRFIGTAQALLFRLVRLAYLISVFLMVTAVWYAVLEGSDFHDGIYFAVTTMTTVGYGDMYPVTYTGRIVVMGVILTSMVLIPAQISSVNDALQQLRQRKRGASPFFRQDFILVLGSFDGDDMRSFAAEFFSDNTAVTLRTGVDVKDLKLVFMAPKNLTDSMISCFSDPTLRDRIQFVYGDPANKKDLLRVNAPKSLAVVILSDNLFDSPWIESDSRCIMYSLVVRAVCRNVPVVCNVFDPSNKLVIDYIGGQQRVFCNSFSETRGQLVGRSLRCPGLSTLFQGLMESNHLRKPSLVSRLFRKQTLRLQPWQKVFEEGQNMELIAVELPPICHGRTFHECAWIMYQNYNFSSKLILIGVRLPRLVSSAMGSPGIRNKSLDKTDTFINPGPSLKIQEGTIGYIIASSFPPGFKPDFAEEVAETKSAQDWTGISRSVSQKRIKMGGSWTPSGQRRKGPSMKTLRSRQRLSSGSANHLIKDEVDQRFPDKKNSDILRELGDVPKDVSGHIVVIGGFAYCDNLMSSMRAHTEEPFNGLVVFLVEEFNESDTQYVCSIYRKYGPIAVVEGRGTHQSALQKVRIQNAKTVYIRRQQIQQEQGKWSRVVDPVTLYLAVNHALPDTPDRPFVISDVYKTTNAEFVTYTFKDGVIESNQPFNISPAFAAGNCINYENWNNSVLPQMIFKPYLPRLLDMFLKGQTMRLDDDTMCSSLELQDIPANFATRTFSDLFGFTLQKDNGICLALYQAPSPSGDGSLLPWVNTNPKPNTRLTPGDRVYVLRSWDWDLTTSLS